MRSRIDSENFFFNEKNCLGIHSPSKCLAWVKKCCHIWLDQNFDPSLLTNKLWLVFKGMKPHGHIGWATSMPFVSINSTNSRTNPWNFLEKILRIFSSFLCFIPIETSQSILVSKDWSKFWSSQMWQHFLTHAKHFVGECILLWLNSPSRSCEIRKEKYFRGKKEKD